VLRSVVDLLRQAKEHGVDTLVDCTALGHGRDLEAVKAVNEQVDLNIVVCTGIYTYDHLPFFFRFGHPAKQVDGRTEDVLTDMFVRDITEGIGSSGVKAALIKTATDRAGVTPNVERILRAVARAHRATGVPITTHTDVHQQNGLDQQRIFAEEGVDLSRVIIGHSGDSTDLDYLRALLDAGSTIGADRFGLYLPDLGLPDMATRIDTVARLCAEGYSDRIVLSHDTTCYGDWLPRDFGAGLSTWQLTHLSDEVLPAMHEHGIEEDQVEQMLVGNPSRILANQGAY